MGGGIQLSDSLVDEAVFEAGGVGTEAPIPSPRGQEAEQTVVGSQSWSLFG